MRPRYLLLTLMFSLIAGVFTARAHAASPATELKVAWWGDLGAIEYPATQRDPAVVQSVQDGLAKFRDTNPDALMVDLGGFTGPICGFESSYAMPPLPFYKETKVNAVNLGEVDWLDLLPADKIMQMPKQDPVALLSDLRLANGKQPAAVQPAVFLQPGGHPVILAGVTRIHPRDYMNSIWTLLKMDQDSTVAVRDAIAPLKEKHPDATVILLADLAREEAAKLASEVGGVDLVLCNRPEETVKAVKSVAGEKGAWEAGRFEAGKIAVGHIRFDTDGAIASVGVDGVDLVPVEKPKGSLWSWLGLASAPPARRVLAEPPPKPIVGINLSDPRQIAVGMGFADASIEVNRCDVPESIHEKISNKKVLSFSVLVGGKEVGRLYRVHLELPGNNGNLITNLVLGADGKIVRATAKVEPMIGLRYIYLTKALKEWEGLEPKQVEVTPEKYPGFSDQLRLLKEAFELAAEIDRICR